MRLILPISLICVFLVACLDNNSSDPGLTIQEQFEIDLGIIDNFLAENNINATEDEVSRLRYVIHEQGSGEAPVGTDSITVNYEGRQLLTGDVFDERDTITFLLNGLIAGWQIGVPLIREGGSITLYIPSVYAYGSTGADEIAPDTNIVFDIDLIEVSN